MLLKATGSGNYESPCIYFTANYVGFIGNLVVFPVAKSLCKFCLTTSAHSRTLDLSNMARKLGCFPGTSVPSALETFATIALYKLTYTIPLTFDGISAVRSFWTRCTERNNRPPCKTFFCNRAQISQTVQRHHWGGQWQSDERPMVMYAWGPNASWVSVIHLCRDRNDAAGIFRDSNLSSPIVCIIYFTGYCVMHKSRRSIIYCCCTATLEQPRSPYEILNLEFLEFRRSCTEDARVIVSLSLINNRTYTYLFLVHRRIRVLECGSNGGYGYELLLICLHFGCENSRYNLRCIRMDGVAALCEITLNSNALSGSGKLLETGWCQVFKTDIDKIFCWSDKIFDIESTAVRQDEFHINGAIWCNNDCL